ncbi:site-specific recombinase, phage integrase family [Nitrosococcus oceani AFC27]|uniref:tyrosine-type recombinase/integrase n=1 Tax=Nitrosococcus oceani TaxID=1229 RepID=UPI000183C21E|nr:tyrosine-type recombinase/integrase [Nitrosococcus oceani]EDZ65587.1 site-specific recombinase, phage integrase family [Nitrosococcus oceani AFC27]
MSRIKSPTLLEDVRRIMRLKHYSLHTERSYCERIKNALVFLYKQVLDMPLTKRIEAIRSKTSRRVPVVLSLDEIRQVLPRVEGVAQLVVKLLYGSGLRISEAVRLRVQDLDYDYKQTTVRSGKGDKDRVTPLSAAMIPLLQNHFRKGQGDSRAGFGRRLRCSVFAVCAGKKISSCRTGMGLAICVSGPFAIGRSSVGFDSTPSYRSIAD